MTERIEAIERMIEPVLASLGLELFDVALVGGGTPTLKVMVDRDGGVDLDAVTLATEAISPVLDGSNLVRGPYALEVSSPGLERPLRRPAHFRGAIGATVSLKTRDAEGRAERHRGVVTAADETGVTIEIDGTPRQFALAEIEQARTVFEWGPTPPPGKAGSPGSGSRKGDRASRAAEKEAARR